MSLLFDNFGLTLGLISYVITTVVFSFHVFKGRERYEDMSSFWKTVWNLSIPALVSMRCLEIATMRLFNISSTAKSK